MSRAHATKVTGFFSISFIIPAGCPELQQIRTLVAQIKGKIDIAVQGLATSAQHLRAFLAWGVTTVVDPGIPVHEAERALAHAATHPAPELVFVGPLLGPTHGYPSAILPTIPGITDPAQVAQKMDAYAHLEPIGVKVTFEDGLIAPIWPLHNADMQATIQAEAAARDLPLYIHWHCHAPVDLVVPS